jgi:CHAD domain-containing protein
MKQKKISAVINKRFKKLNKLFCEIINGFEMEPIHDFRTGIKKLRAFFRLLNVEINAGSQLKVPKKLKTFYGYAGTIRNLQLQLKSMDGYAENPRYTATGTYIEYLKRMIEKWKEHSIEFKGLEDNFYSDEKKIIKQLPGKLSKASIKKFLQNKMDELAYLIKELPDDDVLHSIRKLLKDLLYNWVLIKQYNKLLPPMFSGEEEIKSFTELVGLFLDKSIGINLLETYYRDCEENGLFFETEIKELQEIEDEWKREKQQLAQIIYLNPGLLNLSTAGDHIQHYAHQVVNPYFVNV